MYTYIDLIIVAGSPYILKTKVLQIIETETMFLNNESSALVTHLCVQNCIIIVITCNGWWKL